MNDDAPLDGQSLDNYRDFLAYLARLQLDPRRQAKLDEEELVQETLLAAHAASDQLRAEEPAQVKAWLRQILPRVLANKLRDLRAQKRDAKLERSLNAALDDSSARLEALLAAEQSTPSEQVLRNERALLLEVAMRDLPGRQREVVALNHLHGWTMSAICGHLKLSPGAVAGLLNRGLKQLRDKLGPDS